MPESVFYSWQSDLPNNSNRSFIEGVLEAVAKRTVDEQGQPVIVVDRDTKDVPGSPDISDSILSKIASAGIMVADVSIVQRGSPRKTDSPEADEGGQIRPTPNPNVLFELGYAVRALGWERIVLVFNQAYGEVRELPFDLTKKRMFTYHFHSAEEKAEAKSSLIKSMQEAILHTLTRFQRKPVESQPAALDLLNQRLSAGGPGLEAGVIDFWHTLLDKAKGLVGWDDPEFHQEAVGYEKFLELLTRLTPVVEEFSKSCYRCASYKSLPALTELYRGFADLASMCDLPRDHTGYVHTNNYDVFRFIGHEMFTTFVAAMLKHQCWSALASDFWGEDWGIFQRHRLPMIHTTAFSRNTHILSQPEKENRRISLRTDLLNERHKPGGPLAKACPLLEFQAGDLFLLMRHVAQSQPQQGYNPVRWVPWSCAFADELPTFLLRASTRSAARNLADAIGVASTEQLKEVVHTSAAILAKWFETPIDDGPDLAHLMKNAEIATRGADPADNAF